jgi:hypothetical protein
MGSIYRLTPTNRSHESWRRSKVTNQYVRLWAHDCADARDKAARATENLHLDAQAPKARYALLENQKSPWELSETTLCEEDLSDPTPPANNILTEDGTLLPIWASAS